MERGWRFQTWLGQLLLQGLWTCTSSTVRKPVSFHMGGLPSSVFYRHVSKQNHDSKSEERKKKEKLFFFLYSVILCRYHEDIIICVVVQIFSLVWIFLNWFKFFKLVWNFHTGSLPSVLPPSYQNCKSKCASKAHACKCTNILIIKLAEQRGVWDQ